MTSAYGGVPGLNVSAADGILRVEMDDGKRRNALNDVSIEHFVAVLRQAQTDPDLRAVLVTGAGSDFCSGFDIVARNAGGDSKRQRTGSIQRRLPNQAHDLMPVLCGLQLPVVAAVRGYAVGIGLQIVLACDFAVVSGTATLWEPFVKRGMTPDSGATWLLPRIVGPLRARQMLMLGRRVTGAEAAEWGIAHEALPDDEVTARAEALAAELAAGPTVSLGLTKWLISTGADRSLRDHLAAEAFGMEVGSRSPDFREGLKAFVEKRTPDFTGM
jgi:2-(1,2-epoxy-1,2-dihydrophenyl)acetyl-CoA isomerase